MKNLDEKIAKEYNEFLERNSLINTQIEKTYI